MLINGMTALIGIEARVKADSGIVNHQGIDITASLNAYMDFNTQNGTLADPVKVTKLGVAAQTMAGDIRTALATGQLSAGEVAQLQGVMEGLTGSAELAEAYVGVNPINIGTMAIDIGASATDIGASATDIGKAAADIGATAQAYVDSGESAGDNGSGRTMPKTAQEFYPYANEIAKRYDLTVEEKVQAQQQAYEMLGDGNRKDLHVPADAKFLKATGFDEKGRPDIDWPERWGMKEGTIKPIESDAQLPYIIDRDGQLAGNSGSPLKENGQAYTYDEKSLPFIPNPEAKHQAIRNGRYYIELINAIKANDLDTLNVLLNQNGIDRIDQDEMDQLVQKYRRYINEAKTRLEDVNATYGFYGIADKWERNGEVYLTGGAPQFTFPLSIEQLIQFGIYS